MDREFATAGRRGSWEPSRNERGVCSECSASQQRRAKPLMMLWEAGSDVVGDFVWPGFDSEVVVTDRVFRLLHESFEGFETGPVEIVEDEDAPRANQRDKRRVRLPDDGRDLRELWVTAWVHLDRDRSSVELERRCGTCAAEFWEVYGVERWDSHFDRENRQLVRTKTERLPDAGIFIKEADLGPASIFRVHEFPAWVFCTDRVRELVEEEGLANVAFLEMGATY